MIGPDVHSGSWTGFVPLDQNPVQCSEYYFEDNDA